MQVTIAQVREWANDNGFTVGTRGRLPAEVQQAYAKKFPKRQIVAAS